MTKSARRRHYRGIRCGLASVSSGSRFQTGISLKWISIPVRHQSPVDLDSSLTDLLFAYVSKYFVFFVLITYSPVERHTYPIWLYVYLVFVSPYGADTQIGDAILSGVYPRGYPPSS